MRAVRACALAGLFLIFACNNQGHHPAACDDASASAVTATITQGKGLPAGSAPVSTFPYTVVVRTTSGVLVEAVRVGGVSATLTNAEDQEWTAQLSSSDLEANRGAGASEANLEVTAKTVCSDDYTSALDETVVPLGPAPGLAVAGLGVAVEYVGSASSGGGGAGGDGGSPEVCSVPVDQSVAALIRITAAVGSEGAKVTAQTSTGSFVGGTDHSVELTLQKSNGQAEALAYWLPSIAGQTVVTAFAAGSTAPPRSLLVVAAPAIHGPTIEFERGVTYPATIRTSGELDSCVLEEILPGAATVQFVDPALGKLDRVISLIKASDAFACEEPKAFQLQIEFGETAKDGTEGVLRCFDSFGQEGDFTFAVAPSAGAGGAGG